MRILHLPNYYPPYIGGIGEVCYYIANCLVDEPEVEQKVICFHDENKRVQEVVHGVEVIRAKSFAQIMRQQISFDMLPVLRRVFREFQPDIVHFHMPNPLACLYLLMCLPNTTKLIVHWHCDIVGMDLAYKIVKHLEKAVLKRADLILITSPQYATHSKPLKPFLDKIDVLPNIISNEKVCITEEILKEAERIKAQYGGKPIIFTIGRHVPYKGLEYLINAEPLIKSDCVILIGGKGPLTDKLKEMAKGRERIIFIGFLPDKEMIEHMCAADIFAFPSITKNEAFGIALAEAMYCGAVPVTMTIEGSGVNWVSINGETGLEVDTYDYEAYAEAIDKLLQNSILYNQLRKNAKARVEKMFTLDAIRPLILGFYKKVASSRL